MGDYYSDEHAGGKSYAQHQEIARSNERVRQSLSPSDSTTGGSYASGGDSVIGGVAIVAILVFFALGVISLVSKNWDEVLVALTLGANDLIGAFLQNWFWLSAFSFGILFLLSGFAKRADAWKNPSKLVPEILMLLGTALLFFGEMESAYGKVIFWYSPFVMGAISIMVLYIFILMISQPERFVIKSRFIVVIKRLIVVPFVAIIMSLLFFFIIALIAHFGFGVAEGEIRDHLIFSKIYVASWPLSFYLACQKG